MLTKVLVFIAIAAVIYLLGRHHARRRRVMSAAEHTPKPLAAKSRMLILSAFMVVPLVLVWMVYQHWQQERRLMRVKVVNTQNGQSAQYQARLNAIQLRSFQDLDGRRIVLADQERMEIDPLP